MNAQDWLNLLPIVSDRGWPDPGSQGFIRDRDGRCPLCALAHEVSGGAVSLRGDWKDALRRAGLPFVYAAAIANAADNAEAPLRAALERALGVRQ